jgi:hypothetical protein
MAANKFASHQFTILLTVLSLVLLILFALFAQYSGEANPVTSSDFENVSRNAPRKLDPLNRDAFIDALKISAFFHIKF